MSMWDAVEGKRDAETYIATNGSMFVRGFKTLPGIIVTRDNIMDLAELFQGKIDFSNKNNPCLMVYGNRIAYGCAVNIEGSDITAWGYEEINQVYFRRSASISRIESQAQFSD